MIRIAWVLLALALGQQVSAQDLLKGKVIDRAGNPIEKASILSASGQSLAVTDPEGMFTARTSAQDSVIMVKSIGYVTARVGVRYDQPLLVTLTEDMYALDEVDVVHTGYQQLPKDRATGSFVTISEEMLNQRVGSSLLERLEDYMPGLQFENRSGSKDLHIRGLSTFNLTMTSPLIIVDNFPYEGDLDNINPADIESVTLLRDAAATSIWGARAGNGVLVITRKKAKQTPLAIQYRANGMFTEKDRIEKLLIMSSGEFIEVEKMLFEKGFYDRLFDPATNRQTILSPVVDMLDRHRRGLISQDELDAFVENASGLDYRTQMKQYLYAPPTTMQQSLSLGAGHGRFAYRTSVGYDRSTGDRKNTNSDRLTLSQNFSFQLMEKLRLDVSLDLTSSKGRFANSIGNYPLRPGDGRFEFYPYLEFVDGEGRPLTIPQGFNPYYLERLAADHPSLLDWTYSPLEDLEKGRVSDSRQQAFSGINLKYSILNGLDFDVFYGNESQRTDRETLYREDSYYVRNLVNMFTQIDGDGYLYPVPHGAIMDQGRSRLISHRGRAMLSLDRTVKDIHHIYAIAGTDLSATRTMGHSNRYYGLDERLLNTVAVDQHNMYATFDRLQGTQRIPYGARLTELNDRFMSFYANASYSLLDRYTLTGSARRDASNIFGVNTNRRWNPLWSVGVAWQLHQEEWMPSIGWLEQLKIRSTYGHSGNAGGITTTLPILAYVNYSPDWLTNYPRAQVRSLPNADLRWEDVAMFNLGVDWTVLNGGLWGSFEYFTKTSTDLLASDRIDPTIGFSSMTKNVGEMQGKGFDIMLNGRIDIGDFSWVGNFNLSKSTNKIVEYYGSSSNASFYAQNAGTAMRPLEGYSPYPVFAYRFAGLDPENGDPLGYYNQEISTDYRSIMRDSVQNMTYYGTSMSPFFGSFRHAFRWENIELSCLFSYKFGGFKQKQTIRYNDIFNSWSTHSDYTKRWQQPGDDEYTTVPSMVYPANSNRDDFYAYSEPNIFDAGYIRLRDVRLSYSFPIRSKAATSQLNVALIGNNLGMLWTANTDGIDPDNFPLPLSRSYSISIAWNY